jgi:hypothetical protein
MLTNEGKPMRIKVFWFFFSKKNCFLYRAGVAHRGRQASAKKAVLF